MRHLVLASRNAGKLRELRELIAPLGLEVRSSADFPAVGEIPETGATFEENARLKAETLRDASGLPALADDSGLSVDALGGRPGVHSARYAGPGATDADNNARLLSELSAVPQGGRGAEYVCVIAWAVPGAPTRFFRASARGRIVREARGAGGFGYDPYFLSDDLGVTFAEAEPAAKHAVSHRGLAMRRWLDFLLSPNERSTP